MKTLVEKNYVGKYSVTEAYPAHEAHRVISSFYSFIWEPQCGGVGLARYSQSIELTESVGFKIQDGARLNYSSCGF